MKITRTFDLLDQLKDKYPKNDILAYKRQGQWVKFSVDDYIENSLLLAYGFLAYGLQPNDKVVTCMNNRPQWNFLDMGLPLAKLIHVPIYTTLSVADYTHIITHSDAKIVVIGNKQIYKNLYPIIQSLPNPPKVFVIDEIENATNLNEIFELGRQNRAQFQTVIEENKKTIQPDDLCTIIYTSGTTGIPKGVMLSHGNIVFNFLGHAAQQIKNSTHKALSFLPLCHIYERSMNYEFQSLGISIYYAESLATIASDIHDIKADVFCAVPRVLEMMFDKLHSAGKDLSGIKRWIYSWAFHLGEQFDYENNSWWYNKKLKIADQLVYSKWREKFSGKEMLIVSGSSSIQARIIRLFSAAGMFIFEGYGMTETAPVIAVNNPKEMKINIGTVGKVMEGVQLKFAQDQEILTKGPHLMLGYYKDPDYTHQVIDEDGWFHTGDIGELTPQGYLKITDRKKEIFKLSAGKYIAPQLIENKFKESIFIDNIMVIGENEKFASAIITPNFTRLHFWAAKHKLHYQDNNELISLPLTLARFQREVDKFNLSLAPHEQIKRFRLINAEWTSQNGFLSQTLKLKRNVLYKKYDAVMREIYHKQE
ncbi:MAG: long-chain fatty acid--CoA ligase [Bacteroidales bacterium]|nr:long-chain fatty acid--CoA ligase [Bacteroidales bacterium]